MQPPPLSICDTVTRHYCKVNEAPYLLELDLASGINTEQATVTVDARMHTVTIAAPKLESGICWGRATADGDDNEIRIRRNASLVEAAEREAEVRCSSSLQSVVSVQPSPATRCITGSSPLILSRRSVWR